MNHLRKSSSGLKSSSRTPVQAPPTSSSSCARPTRKRPASSSVASSFGSSPDNPATPFLIYRPNQPTRSHIGARVNDAAAGPYRERAASARDVLALLAPDLAVDTELIGELNATATTIGTR
jgi:hypothetical protein